MDVGIELCSRYDPEPSLVRRIGVRSIKNFECEVVGSPNYMVGLKGSIFANGYSTFLPVSQQSRLRGCRPLTLARLRTHWAVSL